MPWQAAARRRRRRDRGKTRRTRRRRDAARHSQGVRSRFSSKVIPARAVEKMRKKRFAIAALFVRAVHSPLSIRLRRAVARGLPKGGG